MRTEWGSLAQDPDSAAETAAGGAGDSSGGTGVQVHVAEARTSHAAWCCGCAGAMCLAWFHAAPSSSKGKAHAKLAVPQNMPRCMHCAFALGSQCLCMAPEAACASSAELSLHAPVVESTCNLVVSLSRAPVRPGRGREPYRQQRPRAHRVQPRRRRHWHPGRHRHAGWQRRPGLKWSGREAIKPHCQI